MQYVGWKFNLTRPEARESLLTELRALVCYTLNLCASAGCACVTGVGEKVCSETAIRGGYPLSHSQGPDWSVTLMALDKTVMLHIYFSGPVLGTEMRDLHQALVAFDLPLFQSALIGMADL